MDIQLGMAFQDDELVVNAFVAAYAKCGLLCSAKLVFNVIETKIVSSLNALISGYAQNDAPMKALEFFLQMTNSGLGPNYFNIRILLLACSHLKSLHFGYGLHGYEKEALELFEKMQALGHKLNAFTFVDSVLHELGEDENIEVLQGHNEKLAISFGLLRTSKGETVGVSKNLCIYVYCPNVAKLISKAIEKEIVV
ncbi:hypothetical protein QUC31_006094 [Theobroma cacao]